VSRPLLALALALHRCLQARHQAWLLRSRAPALCRTAAATAGAAAAAAAAAHAGWGACATCCCAALGALHHPSACRMLQCGWGVAPCGAHCHAAGPQPRQQAGASAAAGGAPAFVRPLGVATARVRRGTPGEHWVRLCAVSSNTTVPRFTRCPRAHSRRSRKSDLTPLCLTATKAGTKPA
jgi:hypothetical protein